MPSSFGKERTWPLLLAGLALLVGLALWQGGDARRAVADYAQRHAATEAKGFGVWLYDNPFLVGTAQYHRKPCPRIHQPFTPRPRRATPFSWRWLALVRAPVEGDYVLGVYAAEAVRLRVDGRPLIERWVGGPPRQEMALVYLEPGWHLLDLSNVQERNRLELTLWWIPPGASQRELIPSQNLRPLREETVPARLNRLYQAVDRWRVLVWVLPLLWLAMWWLALRRPARTWAVLREHRWFLLVLGVAAVLRLAFAASVHGISGESAFFAWRAELILQGAWPFHGMNTRVGPTFDYLLTLPVAVFGVGPWMLRGTAAVLNLLSLVFCYRVMLREAGRSAALAACLVLAVKPAVVVFARIPVEQTALGPLLFFLGLDLFSLARRRPPLALVGGLLWGLGMYTHSIFIVFPFTLGVAGLILSRRRFLASPVPWGMGLGLGLGMLPRMIERWFNPHRQDPMSFFDPARLEHLPGFSEIFLRATDGEIVYKMFTGQHLWHTWGVIPICLGLAAVVGLWHLGRREARGWWIGPLLVIALAVYLLMAPVGAPSANPRYFGYALILAGLLMGWSWSRVYESLTSRLRPWAVAGLLAFAAFCTASLGVNYFYAHLTTGGRPLVWKNPLLDHTSDAWMNHGLLVEELLRRGYPVVAAGDYWHWTLHLALNLYQGRPHRFQAVAFGSRAAAEWAAVFYNSPEGRDRLAKFLQGHRPRRYRRVELPPHLSSKYILIERTWPPVTYPDLEGLW